MQKILFFLLFFPFLVCASQDLAKTQNYYQINLGGGLFNIGDGWAHAPVISLGKRFGLEDNAAIEVTAAWGEQGENNQPKFRYYALPKISYLKFYPTSVKSAVFYGGGLSWSKVAQAQQKFEGLFLEGTLGYELQRHVSVHLDIAQPILAQNQKGSHPGPAFMLGMSVGF